MSSVALADLERSAHNALSAAFARYDSLASPASPLPLVTLGLALGDADHGVHEEGGENRGARVKMYLEAAGISVPAPWCAAWANERAQRAASELGTESPLETVVHQALVQSYWNWASQTDRLVADPRPGDLVLFRFPKGPPRWNHVGFVVRPPDDTEFRTVEGNTSPGVGGSLEEREREGEGVYVKSRDLTKQPVAFVRWA